MVTAGFVNNLPLVVLWAGLILAVLLRGRGRFDAWGILVPTAVVQAAAVLLRRMHLYLPGELVALIGQVMTSLALGVAILWVVADRMDGRRRSTFLGGAICLFVFIAGLGVFGKARLNLSHEMAAAAFLYAVTVPALLIGLILAFYFCRGQNILWRFGLWLLFWVVLLCAVGSVLVTTTTLLIEPPAPDEWFGITVTAFILGSVLGEVLFGALVPFLVFAAVNPGYRSRLTAYLGPPPKSPFEIDEGNRQEKLADE